MTSRTSPGTSPLATSPVARAGPTPPGERQKTAVAATSASTIASLAITMPVRNAGSPSFDRLRHTIVCSSQTGVAGAKTMPGNGNPYALSRMSGTPRARATARRRSTSASVTTLPVGLPGRERQMAPMPSTSSSPSKSTPYLNSLSPSSRTVERRAGRTPGAKPTSA